MIQKEIARASQAEVCEDVVGLVIWKEIARASQAEVGWEREAKLGLGIDADAGAPEVGDDLPTARTPSGFSNATKVCPGVSYGRDLRGLDNTSENSSASEASTITVT